MLSNYQKVAGHVPPGPTYGDTPVSLPFFEKKPVQWDLLKDVIIQNYEIC